jgi:NADH dehydrogenase FAD-containing subunit
MNKPLEEAGRPQLVILGTGFGAFSLLHHLDRKHYDVSVVSPRNHFLFTPLLPSTTVGTLEFRSIIEPIRNMQDRLAIKFYQATCTRIDPATKLVTCEGVFDRETFPAQLQHPGHRGGRHQQDLRHTRA